MMIGRPRILLCYVLWQNLLVDRKRLVVAQRWPFPCDGDSLRHRAIYGAFCGTSHLIRSLSEEDRELFFGGVLHFDGDFSRLIRVMYV